MSKRPRHTKAIRALISTCRLVDRLQIPPSQRQHKLAEFADGTVSGRPPQDISVTPGSTGHFENPVRSIDATVTLYRRLIEYPCGSESGLERSRLRSAQ